MIKFDKALMETGEIISLGILRANVNVFKSDEQLIDKLNQVAIGIQTEHTLEDYRNETLIASRKVYKLLGKDPSRYRISSDSLYRRIIKGKGLYYVNNVVDINNLISLKTLWSIGAYDFDKIEGQIIYGVGRENEPYEGIGRGQLNIMNLPVLRDSIGSFGSATSDSLRTMVTEDTNSLLLVIHAFGGDKGLKPALEDMKDLLIEHADAKGIAYEIL